ncbi:helix-turn-helix transcriptional regulator [Agrobacterium sp. OT33]|nr:helix-turn-helix transcriptional regulator [Agrobacterium sp. OT33]
MVVMSSELDDSGKREADFLKQLANPKRLLICSHLVRHEEDVNSLARKVGLSQSALSQHLTRLQNSGLITFRKEAQFRYYSCHHRGVTLVIDLLKGIFNQVDELETCISSTSCVPLASIGSAGSNAPQTAGR